MMKKEELLVLETQDYQNRNGDYPKSGIADTVEVYEENQFIAIEGSFKNTSEETAMKWMKNYVSNAGYTVEKTTAFQDGDYADDWVNATAYVSRHS